MLDVFNIAKPQNCDIQSFYGFGNQATSTDRNYMTWNKPRGVSHVYMLLIGGGGTGNATSGGGSGVVTVWYGSAQNVPDSLAVYVRGENANNFHTTIAYRSSTGLVTLLTATSTSNASGANAASATAFAASGFYQSTDGDGGASGPKNASSITFLSGGAGSTNDDVNANYGYNSTAGNAKGFFQLSPIIVGVGGSGSGLGGIGCGGGLSGPGGPGFALIASW
jgi:hypothetical protein